MLPTIGNLFKKISIFKVFIPKIKNKLISTWQFY